MFGEGGGVATPTKVGLLLNLNVVVVVVVLVVVVVVVVGEFTVFICVLMVINMIDSRRS